MRVPLLTAFFTVLLTTNVAQAYYPHYNDPYYAPRHQQAEDPVKTIQDALDKLKTFSANSDNVNPILLRSFIENEIIPYFDFARMTYWIAGPYARSMSESELFDLEERLKSTFLSSLARHMGDFDAGSTKVTFRPASYRDRNEANVTAMVYRKNVRPARLEFRMQREGPHWTIIDVKANGTSAVLYYRKHFSSSLRQYR